MKERIKLNVLDYYLFGFACILVGVFLTGFFMGMNPVGMLFIFVKYRIAFLLLAVIIGIKPLWVALYGRKDAEGKNIKTVDPKKTSKKVKKNAKK